MKSLSHLQLLATPWTVALQAPPSVGFSGQEYWSGVPFPSPDQCLSVAQMKYHILLLPIYSGVLYFVCVLKYNLAMFFCGGQGEGKFQRLRRNLYNLLPSLIHTEMRLDHNPRSMSSVCCLLFTTHSAFLSICSVILNYSFAYRCKTSIREFLQICHYSWISELGKHKFQLNLIKFSHQANNNPYKMLL